jgi:putative MATE family efflux protein
MSQTDQDLPAVRLSPWRIFVLALQGKHYDYTSGSMRDAVVLLSVPIVLEMIAQSLFAVTSVFWVSRIDSEAVAIVGLTEAAMSLVYAFSIGISIAATAFVARRIGEGVANGTAERAAGQVVVLGTIVSLLLGLALWVSAEEVLLLFGAEQGLAERGRAYAEVMFLFNITVFVMSLLNAILRGCGDPAYAMRALWLANGVDLVLAPCLVFGLGPFPELGLVGAAVAVVLSRSVGIAFQLWRLSGGHGRLKLRFHHFVPIPDDLKRIALMSWSGVARMVISTTSGIGLFAIAAQSGTVALAGSTIALRVVQFVMLPALGLSFAAATLVGQNLGAGRPDRAEEAVRIAVRLNVMVLAAIALLLFVLAGPAAALFASDTAVLREATMALRIVAIAMPLYAAAMCLESAFNGAGDTWTPAVVNFFCLWCLQIPLAWVLSQHFGLGTVGVFASVPIGFGVLAAIAAVLFVKGRWKSHSF